MSDKKGMKFDDGKSRWDLLPLNIIEDVVKVLMIGAAKYEDYNWQDVVQEDMGEQRYFAAAMRHITAWRSGEIIDEESGCHHLSHAMCCFIFLMWNDKNGVRR